MPNYMPVRERLTALEAVSLVSCTYKQGTMLLVVTTWREDRVRVVTAFEPINRLVQFYYEERGR